MSFNDLVPTWWQGSQDSCQALAHAVPHAVVPQLLRPMLAALLPHTSITMATVHDAACCVTKLTRSTLASGATDESLAGILHLGSLTGLNLPLCSSLTAAGFAHLVKSSTLTSLSLWKCSNLGADAVREIAKVSQLELLSMSAWTVEAPMLASIANLRRLTTLDLSYCASTEPCSLLPIATLPELTSLDIHDFEAAVDLDRLDSLPKLRTLDLGGLSLGLSESAAIGRCSSLTLLCLYQCGPLDHDQLKAVAALPHLTDLDLSYCVVDEVGMAHVSGITSLTSLGLCGCRDFPASAFEDIASLRNLTALDVEQITAITARDLAPLATLPHLTELEVDPFSGREMLALKKHIADGDTEGTPLACAHNALKQLVRDAPAEEEEDEEEEDENEVEDDSDSE